MARQSRQFDWRSQSGEKMLINYSAAQVRTELQALLPGEMRYFLSRPELSVVHAVEADSKWGIQ